MQMQCAIMVVHDTIIVCKRNLFKEERGKDKSCAIVVKLPFPHSWSCAQNENLRPLFNTNIPTINAMFGQIQESNQTHIPLSLHSTIDLTVGSWWQAGVIKSERESEVGRFPWIIPILRPPTEHAIKVFHSERSFFRRKTYSLHMIKVGRFSMDCSYFLSCSVTR